MTMAMAMAAMVVAVVTAMTTAATVTATAAGTAMAGLPARRPEAATVNAINEPLAASLAGAGRAAKTGALAPVFWWADLPGVCYLINSF